MTARKVKRDAASRYLANALTRQGVASVSEIADLQGEPRGRGVDVNVTLTNGRQFNIRIPQNVLLETYLASGSLRERIRRRLLVAAAGAFVPLRG